MPSYPNLEVEREIRSRITGAMEAATEKRESDLTELAGSRYAPGPGCGSGPYEQKRVEIYVGFYDTLFQDIVDNWFEVLTRQNGSVTEGDVDHIIREVEEWAYNAPRNIQQALISRGTTAARLPHSTITALGDGAGQRVHGLVTKYRRELKTRLYDQNHPHPKETAPVPIVNISSVNSGNVNSIVLSGSDNRVVPPVATNKGWWETWWGVIVTAVIAGLIIWGITRYWDKPSSKPSASMETQNEKSAEAPNSAPGSRSDGARAVTSEPAKPEAIGNRAKAERKATIDTNRPTQNATAPKRGVSSSGIGSPAIGSVTQGPGSALSVNQRGGITAGTIIGNPPCPWAILTQEDFIKIATLSSSRPAKIYIAIPPSNDDAARFAGYLQSALNTINHWNTDDFEIAVGTFWAKYPGITVIARDRNDFSDLTKPAARLKNAIQSMGVAVHTEQVVALKADDDLGLWVGTCK
jgi:hypothetical protein